MLTIHKLFRVLQPIYSDYYSAICKAYSEILSANAISAYVFVNRADASSTA